MARCPIVTKRRELDRIDNSLNCHYFAFKKALEYLGDDGQIIKERNWRKEEGRKSELRDSEAHSYRYRYVSV